MAAVARAQPWARSEMSCTPALMSGVRRAGQAPAPTANHCGWRLLTQGGPRKGCLAGVMQKRSSVGCTPACRSPTRLSIRWDNRRGIACASIAAARSVHGSQQMAATRSGWGIDQRVKARSGQDEVDQSYVSKVERGERYMDALFYLDWCRACKLHPEAAITDSVKAGA